MNRSKVPAAVVPSCAWQPCCCPPAPCSAACRAYAPRPGRGNSIWPVPMCSAPTPSPTAKHSRHCAHATVSRASTRWTTRCRNSSPSRAKQAAWIYRANIGLIERADAVLANLNFFRGAEPDSGTAFEVGYATALGKPVYGYVDDAGSYAERIRRHAPELIGEDPTRDRDGMTLEEFGLPLNLMLAVPATLVVGDAEQALRQLASRRHG